MSSHVLVKRFGKAALITLNRAEALNALSLDMIKTLTSVIQELETEGRLIVVEGGPKAFCAGGDVRSLYDDALLASHSKSLAQEFFTHEYRLNYLIGSLSVPYIALIHGITFGGGVGISIHGSHRVATEETLFAMPENAIGLFPDVGSSYFLPRLGGHLGEYLGITGARLRGAQVATSGVSTHYIHSTGLRRLRDSLLESGHQDLESLCEAPSQQQCQEMEELRGSVDRTFCGDSVEEICSLLKQDRSQWARDTLEAVQRQSPTSTRVTLKMLRQAPADRAACFALEYKLARNFASNLESDFYEGVRAVLVDKDHSPKWKPVADIDYLFQSEEPAFDVAARY